MTSDIRIFRSHPSDALTRLAERDSQLPPTGPVIAAEVDGELRAALPLDGGAAIADPFQHTAEVVRLLKQARRSTSRRRRPLLSAPRLATSGSSR